MELDIDQLKTEFIRESQLEDQNAKRTVPTVLVAGATSIAAIYFRDKGGPDTEAGIVAGIFWLTTFGFAGMGMKHMTRARELGLTLIEKKHGAEARAMMERHGIAPSIEDIGL